MSMTVLVAFAAVAAVLWVGQREHRALQRSRQCLFDGCEGILAQEQLTFGADNFPRLDGKCDGRPVRAELIPDTMTIRRLPQLWLSASLLERNAGTPGLDILVRPTGNEFYALSDRFPCRFETPADFPAEALIRGDHGAGPLLDKLQPTLAAILADARVKEIAVTNRGVRIVRQVGEGKRGEHLLLRQAHFEDAMVRRSAFHAVLTQLQSLGAIVSAYGRARAA